MKNHIDDVREVWKSTGLSPVQGFFIAAGIIAVGLSIPSFQKHQARIEALEELSNRCDELPFEQMYFLIRALINK